MAVDQQHREYAEWLPRWTRCRDCAGGSDAVKARRIVYLPTLEGVLESSDDYSRYLTRALFFPAFGRTTDGLVGTVMRRPPVVRVAGPVEKQLDDLSLSHDPLDAVITDTVRQLLTVGRHILCLDWRGQQLGRPYWTAFRAEQVVAWREAWTNGRWQPVLAVVREVEPEPAGTPDTYVDAEVEQYRVFALTTAGAAWVLYRRLANEWVATDRGMLTRSGRPLPFLPLVFVGPEAMSAAVQKPPLLDLADVNLSHYRTSADLEHGRHFVALPTPWIAGWTSPDGQRLAIGSGTAWEFADKDVKVGMLEFTGQGLKALSDAADEKRKMMAVLGARLLEEAPRSAETAEAVRLRHAGEHSALAGVARAASIALTHALRMHAWWLGDDGAFEDPAIDCQLSTEYAEARLDAQALQALLAAWQAGGISGQTYYYNLQQGGVARPGVAYEVERAEVEAEESLREEVAPPEPAEGEGEPGGEREGEGGVGDEEGDDGAAGDDE